MQDNFIAQSCDLVIFGAKGDLARRKLFPSLYFLEKEEHIHPETRIIGVGRAEWSKDDFIKFMGDAVRIFIPGIFDEMVWNKLSARFDFCNLDVNNVEDFARLAEKVDTTTRTPIYYFAMPPNTFGLTCQGLGVVGLNVAPSRIVMEKPLGSDLKTSQEINEQVAKYFDESRIYRIDHYLAKETVLNLLALRFSNALFASRWDNSAIDYVQITVAEEVGIEGRWGYFDKAGQMRDMVQNHLLQILTMIAMDPPNDLTADSIRDEKVKVLRSLRPINTENINANTVRGQYSAGIINDQKVPGYLEEEGAAIESDIETFVAIRVDIDNWRWAGVPFYLRTGKRLPEKTSEVTIYFKNPPLNLYRKSYRELPQNKLTIRLQPSEGIDIDILSKTPGLDNKHRLQSTKLDLNFSDTFKQERVNDAYERLLLEVMRGIQALFVRRDEVESAWEWVDSIIAAWKYCGEKPKSYQAGSWGPYEAMALIQRENKNRSWNDNE